MEAKMREEVDKEVEEEFNKYLKDNASKRPKEKKQMNWYAVLAISIMALSFLIFLLSIISMIKR
jgi:hypothetical protein